MAAQIKKIINEGHRIFAVSFCIALCKERDSMKKQYANADHTFYAVWKKNAPATYTVSYDANGGSGAPGSQTKTEMSR